jgi:hypothetical protein
MLLEFKKSTEKHLLYIGGERDIEEKREEKPIEDLLLKR